MSMTRRCWFALGAAPFLRGGFHAQDAPPDVRKRGMIVHSSRPEDFEMPLDGFGDFITPADRFFVRSHHYAARVNLSTWKLEIGGLVEKPVSWTFEQIERMPKREITAVIECAGNGRGLYEPPVPGLQWKFGAVGNGRWAGVRLADLLKSAGVRAGAKELLMDGADQPIGAMPKFQRTIPLEKALDPDTLLAYELNGRTLPVLHGFPLRLVAPGWAGDCWMKWVTRLTLIDREFEGFFMKTAYRHPGRPVRPGSAVDPAEMKPVTSLRVKSVIGSPAPPYSVQPGPLKISGAAWSGGSPIAKVEVSLDGGRRWSPARLGQDGGRYSWRLWEHTVPSIAPGYYSVMARAADASGDTQPFSQEWNPSGYQWNVVHAAGVQVGGAAPSQTSASRTEEFPALVKNRCIGCHEADIMTGQRLTRVQWEREVDKMVRWGATVEPAEKQEIVGWFAERFGVNRR
jgi:DMSO/TMAO reductase YedYZ molybdopterin-dependent catalytic subunit